ncbi:alpha/beta hydrolase [Nocardia sp. BMG51109]|uniref:alpha/beta hydrolase n=1 Tax=Nocardia sp. BMG51109 TaxID=1056816 RepID=UPI0004630F55|nr:alpha/beta hydrolase [Nocardia sp. BMG51109]
MTLTVSRIRAGDPDRFATAATQLTQLNQKFITTIADVNSDFDTALENWHGAGASKASIRKTGDTVAATHISTAVADQVDALNDAAAALGAARKVVVDTADAAIADGCTVSEDGHVSAPDLGGGFWQPLADDAAETYEAKLRPALIGFNELDVLYASKLTAANEALAALVKDPSGGALSDRVQQIIDGTAQLPEDPKAFAAFWDSLTPAEKDALFADDPAIGNRDGMPAIDRDHYNRIRLADELARARSGSDPRLADNLRDLEAIERTLNQDPNRMLLVLDTLSGRQPHAAVSVGNPDVADHISVTAPGVDTTVSDSLEGMTSEADALRRTAMTQLDKAGRGDETVATVVWIGADLPQPKASGPGGEVQMASPALALAGSEKLSSFYDGLAASHDGGTDPHLTAVGHSYGSTMTGIAMQRQDYDAVDDLVVYGSPGVGVPSNSGAAEALHLDPGHAYQMTAHSDPVAQLNTFGISPGYLSDFKDMSTQSTTTPDGVERDGATGHAEYARNGDNGQLRTSGYNTAVVVAGLPDQVIEGDSGGEVVLKDILTGRIIPH